MPKKTRKEKMLAARHRQQSTIAPSLVPTYVFESPRSAQTVAVIRDTEELVFIKRDLMRTVFLSMVAIGVEIVLYLSLGGR